MHTHEVQIPSMQAFQQPTALDAHQHTGVVCHGEQSDVKSSRIRHMDQ